MQIFLSYRRSGDPFFPGRLNERLRAARGVHRVFFDVDSIPPGTDFRAVIRRRMTASDIVLVLIGPDWEISKLNSHEDFVRLEIETAMYLDKPLLPVLIADAEMPEANQLPANLAALCYVNALRVRPDPDFEYDFARLLAAITATVRREAALRTDDTAGVPLSAESSVTPPWSPPVGASVTYPPRHTGIEDEALQRSEARITEPAPPSLRRAAFLRKAIASVPIRVSAVALLAVTAIVVVAVRSHPAHAPSTAATPAKRSTSTDAVSNATTSVAATGGTVAVSSASNTTATTKTDAAATTLTIHINPSAKWEDGTPVTASDLECTYVAMLRTTGYGSDASRLSPNGYKNIKTFTSPDPITAVITLNGPYADYRSLFRAVIKRSSVSDCATSARDLSADIPFSAGPWRLRSWDNSAEVLERNDKYWRATAIPKATTAKFVPVSSTSEVQALQQGDVDVIAPPFDADLLASLGEPNIRAVPVFGTYFENWYLQQRSGPFADPDFRAAFVMSVDRTKVLLEVYDKLVPGARLMKCAMWVPTLGPWCRLDHFGSSFQPDAAATRLRSRGWTKSRDGYWQKNGTVPEIRWLTTSGNSPVDKQRADVQALMIPELAKYGFKVRADNTDANTLVNVRLKSFDYELASYGFTQALNPTVTNNFGCDEQGNHTGWCNRQADALMRQSDSTTDERIRASLIDQIDQYFADDHVLVPMVQVPRRILAWRTDRVDGPVDQLASSDLRLFSNLNEWIPKSGTEITVGVDQWPSCLDPTGACVSSLWEVWMAQAPMMPSLWELTTNGYAVTDMVVGEPVLT